MPRIQAGRRVGYSSHMSEYGGSWQARWLTDESPATGWCSVQNAPGPFAIVISLAARLELHAVEFDTASVLWLLASTATQMDVPRTSSIGPNAPRATETTMAINATKK